MREQLAYAVRESMKPGQRKHDLKGQGRPDDGRIYSYSSLHSKLDIAKQYGEWSDTKHLAKWACEITSDHIRLFLEEKRSAGVSQATLDSYASSLRTIGKEIRTVYGSSRITEVERVMALPSTAEHPSRLSRGMREEHYQTLLRSYKEGSSGWTGLILAHSAGLRCGGCVSVRREDIRVYDDHVEVHVTEKGGRHRAVIVTDEHDRELLTKLRDDTRPGCCVCGDREKPMRPDSLERNLERHMEGTGLQAEYRHEKIHSVRKSWAQREYDRYRETHTQLDAVRWVNRQLGHSEDRDEILLARYVEHIH